MKLKNPEKFRKNIKDKITVLIGDEKRAINLEKGIYNYTIKNCDEKNIVKKWDNRHFAIIYIDKVRTIFNNINNKYIQHLLKEKKIKIHKLAFMTHQELEPDKWKQLIEDKKIRDDNKYYLLHQFLLLHNFQIIMYYQREVENHIYFHYQLYHFVFPIILC